MKKDCKQIGYCRVGKLVTIGTLALAAMLIFPAISATAHEWKNERQGPPYGWAKGHEKWKDKYKHHDHVHEWEHRRVPYWARRPEEPKYGERHRPYYDYGRRPYVNYRPWPYEYRYPRDSRQHKIEKSRADLRNARAEAEQGRRQLWEQKEELRKGRAELRRDLRSGASKAEIRQDRQEIRQDRRNIAATRRELRRDRVTLRSARQDLRHD